MPPRAPAQSSARSAPSPARAPRTATPEYAHRLSRLARTAMDLGLSHLLVTNPKDVHYLTGFAGGDSYLLLPAGGGGGGGGGRAMLISDFRYQEELEPVKALAEVVIRRRSMVEAVAEAATAFMGSGKGSGSDAKLGVQAEHMTIAERGAIGRRVGSKRLQDTHGLVGEQRLIKDEFEVGLIRKAAKIQEQALLALIPSIRAGQSELEIAAKLEAEMKTRGSTEPGFKTIVASGANSSLPHYRPSDKKLKPGQPVLIDWGAVFDGYHSDMTRTFCLGKWPEKIREIYTIVLEAQQLAAAALAPGKSSSEIDGIARKHIGAAGYAEQFGHGLGHGIGLNGHEEPRLTNMLGATTLQPGMVVTVEPGIYIPGIGGVRIEDDYVITETGAKNLCTMKKDLDWATL